jgi:hypothetical protein
MTKASAGPQSSYASAKGFEVGGKAAIRRAARHFENPGGQNTLRQDQVWARPPRPPSEVKKGEEGGRSALPRAWYPDASRRR